MKNPAKNWNLKLSHMQNRLAFDLKQADYGYLDATDRLQISEIILTDVGHIMEDHNRMILPLLLESCSAGDWTEKPFLEFRDWVEDKIVPHFPVEKQNSILALAYEAHNIVSIIYPKEKRKKPITEHDEQLLKAVVYMK